MSVAFLVLAHQQPAALARLLRRLAGPRSRLFVHIDRKADRAAMDPELAGIPSEIIPEAESLAVNWGGRYVVHAALALLRRAIADPAVTHAMLLSGACYPVRPIAEIVQRIAATGSRVPVARRLNPHQRGGHNWYINRVSLLDHPWINQRTTPFGRGARGLVEITKLFRRRSYPLSEFYHGGSWWCLERADAEALLRLTDARPELLPWFDYARIPDEIYVQSVLMALPGIGERLKHDFETGGPLATSWTYVDWSVGNPHKPKVLLLEDLSAIRSSGQLFARKTDPVRSAELLDALDREA